MGREGISQYGIVSDHFKQNDEGSPLWQGDYWPWTWMKGKSHSGIWGKTVPDRIARAKALRQGPNMASLRNKYHCD